MTSRISPGRTIAVTGALIGIGAVCGAVMGAVLMAMTALRTIGLENSGGITGGMRFGATVGAPLGAVLTPILSWIFLRRVPLGRAVLETAVGTVAGAAIALVAAPPWFFAGAIGGFIASGINLYVRTRRKQPATKSRLAAG